MENRVREISTKEVSHMKSYVCRQCRIHIPQTFAIDTTKERTENALGTDFAKFPTFSEYVWHLRNIHNVELRERGEHQRRREVGNLICQCWVGLWA